MTRADFNEKYYEYIEKGFYGLEFDIEEVTNYLDKKFEELIKIPNFSYSQIKLKFNMARVYLDPVDSTIEMEKKIDRLIKQRNESN